jgi:phosphate transport system protein
MSPNVRREFDAELDTLKTKLLTMGGSVEAMVADSLSALVTRDTGLATEVQGRDREVDSLQMEVDELTIRILALRQPAATDLRFLIAALKISTDLERVGDLAVNVAERVEELNALPQLKPYIDLPRMTERVRQMIHKALDAFVEGDADRAREVLAEDQEVDDLNSQIFRELITFMLEDPKNIHRATALIFIAKYLERIADHATNVAEDVIFVAEGRDVRHGHG